MLHASWTFIRVSDVLLTCVVTNEARGCAAVVATIFLKLLSTKTENEILKTTGTT